MPLVAPNLDDRTFEDLLAEARTRIARYNPRWTDFNDSDPGMTLVQLFAWLTEAMFYRLNQVPDRNYVKMLQLLNIELRPAQAATVQLTFTADPKAGPTSVPAGAQASASPPEGVSQPLIYETDQAIDLVVRPLVDVQVYDGNEFQVVTNLNDPTTPAFYPLGRVPRAGNALYLGFDPPKTDPNAAVTGSARPAPPFPPQIRFRVYLDVKATAGQPQVCRSADVTPPAPVTLAWEYKPDDTHGWRALSLFRDSSAAFTREGDVVIEAPGSIAPTRQGKPVKPSQGQTQGPGAAATGTRLWLRARLVSPAYPTGREPQISFIRTNTVAARNLATVFEEPIGFSDGTPGQVFTVRRRPVVADGTFVLSVEPQAGDPVVWMRQDDLLASGPDATHFALNANTGEVKFGDGTRGLIPAAGSEIVVNRYRTGGGTAGNVAAHAIETLVTSLGGVTVTNERPAAGGRGEQDPNELKSLAPAYLRCRSRAVTAADYAALAAQAGGMARATAIPLSNPDFPGVDVPGALTVVVVPDNEDDAPVPTDDEIAAVCSFLDPYRVVTAEVHVKGPAYAQVTVKALVTVRPQAAAGVVRQAIVDALNVFLDPLGRSRVNGRPKRVPPSTTTTSGGPLAGKANDDFGRDLYPSRLYGVILQVKDVIGVEQLAVVVGGRQIELGQPLHLPADGLVYGGPHEIRVEPAADVGLASR